MFVLVMTSKAYQVSNVAALMYNFVQPSVVCLTLCVNLNKVGLLLGTGERSAAMVTHLHEAELKTGSGFFVLPMTQNQNL